MSQFAPPRASSPRRRPCIKPTSAIVQDVLDNSRTSILSSVPELSSLTPEQIEFIDTVIKRASATAAATTFLSVFKAYNEVLQERGLDPQHEVVYYGKLLKLGTLKGRNWGEKWEMVKQQQGGFRLGDSVSQTSTLRSKPSSSRAAVLTRLTGALRAIGRDDDAFTLHSHQDDTETEASDAAPVTEADDTPRNHIVHHPPHRSIFPALTTNSLGLRTGPPAEAYDSKPATTMYNDRRPYPARFWDAETSEATGSSGRASSAMPPSTVPPSYRAATRDVNPPIKSSYTPLRALAQAHSRATTSRDALPAPVAHSAPDAARAAIKQARERTGSVINEEDAWKKIRMEQDEKEADQFRNDRLVERYWEHWKEGYRWIIVRLKPVS